MSELKPSFGDVIENGYASEGNPTRRGFFVRAFKRTGRLNPGLTWEITDKLGKFWEVQPAVIGERLTVIPAARAEGPAPVSAPLDREGVVELREALDRLMRAERASAKAEREALVALRFESSDLLVKLAAQNEAGTEITASWEAARNALAKADAILALSQQDQVGLTTPAVEGRGVRSEAIAYFEAFVKRKDEMDRMGYGLRAEEWPEFVATMRATLTGEGCGETYRNWHIRYDPPPIPSRASDWHFAHSDFDGAPDANDNRCGRAASLEAAKAEIDAWIEENFDCRCSAAIPADCMALTCKWRAT